MTEKTLKELVAAAKAFIREIQPEELLAALGNGKKLRLLDVREPAEYLAGAIPIAYHVPRGVLEAKADRDYAQRDPQLQDRSESLVLVCKSGARSALASATLQWMGFTDVASLAGGMDAWINAGHPVVKPAATPY